MHAEVYTRSNPRHTQGARGTEVVKWGWGWWRWWVMVVMVVVAFDTQNRSLNFYTMKYKSSRRVLSASRLAASPR